MSWACGSLMTNWRSLALTGVAPLLGAHAYTCPVAPGGASWRQLAPVGASWCQRVPEGARGSCFNWRSLALTGAHWRPVAPLLGAHAYVPGGTRWRQLAPVGASWRQLAPEGARGCQGVLASIGAHWRSLATSGDQWRRSSVHAFRVLRFRALRLPKMLLKWSLCPREQGRRGPP
jgi:hypothetical protein